MNLKESYRYANYLDSLLNTSYTYLRNNGFVTTTTENHLRSKANVDAQDEKIEVQKPFDVDFTPNQVIDFVVDVLAEKEALVDAIANAKACAEINIDNAIAMNKKKQGFVNILSSLANIKPSEKQRNGSDYKFNAEGNQVQYYYTVVETVGIDYDRKSVRSLSKKLLKETDEISAKLDAIEINTILDFTPLFDVNTSFEDSIIEHICRKDK